MSANRNLTGCLHTSASTMPGINTGFQLEALRTALPMQWRDFFVLDYRPVVASTQDVLQEKAAAGSLHGYVCVTDHQTAGRGRSGREWQGGQAENLQCSLGWEITKAPDPAMSLVVGVAIIRALTGIGLSMGNGAAHSVGSGDKSPRVGLKWPNDVMLAGEEPKKLGGVLVESAMRGKMSQYRIGMGINFALSEASIATIDQPVSDLQRAGLNASREVVLAAVLMALVNVLPEFGEHGFAAFRDEWQQSHLFQGKTLSFEHVGERFNARVAGVDEHGALGLDMRQDAGNELSYFSSGEVRACKPEIVT